MPPTVGSRSWQNLMTSSGILGSDLEIEDVEVGELLEEVPLAFHHRLAGERADVAEAEHGGAVGDDGDEVALGRVLVGELGIALDLEAGLGDAGRVGEREVALVGRAAWWGRPRSFRGGRSSGSRVRPGVWSWGT